MQGWNMPRSIRLPRLKGQDGILKVAHPLPMIVSIFFVWHVQMDRATELYPKAQVREHRFDDLQISILATSIFKVKDYHE